ncbi:hypothetical protein ACFSKM_22135 [Ancylobacter dichloromethanicus]
MLFFPGHDPTDMDYHHGRFANQAERFGRLWSVEVAVTPRLDDGAQPYARWDVEARGPNWSTRTDYRILRWEDIIGALDSRPDPIRLWRGFGGLWDFLRGGAARGYFRASPRYGAFFFFPYLIAALFLGAGLLVGGLVAWGASQLLPASIVWIPALAAGVATFFSACSTGPDATGACIRRSTTGTWRATTCTTARRNSTPGSTALPTCCSRWSMRALTTRSSSSATASARR